MLLDSTKNAELGANCDIVAIQDAAGNVIATYEYDAWGNQLTEQIPDSIGEINPIRYRGYYFDTETGYYYCQSRYYNPEWCRWISADVHGYPGWHYGHEHVCVLLDPVNGFDPSGFASKLPWGAVFSSNEVHNWVTRDIVNKSGGSLVRERRVYFSLENQVNMEENMGKQI